MNICPKIVGKLYQDKLLDKVTNHHKRLSLISPEYFSTTFSTRGEYLSQRPKLISDSQTKLLDIVTREGLPQCDPGSPHFGPLSISPQHPALQTHSPVDNTMTCKYSSRISLCSTSSRVFLCCSTSGTVSC